MTEAIFKIEDREYTAEDAQKKIENADQHIHTIEEENAELRKKVDEYMDALAKTTPPQEDPKEVKSDNEPTPGITAEDVQRIVKETLTANTQKSQEETNLDQVKKGLLERFNNEEEANKAFEKRAKELGTNVDGFIAMAKSTPTAVLELFPAPAPATTGTTVTGSKNTEAISTLGVGSKEGTWKWWQEVRKNDPKYYDSPSAAHKRMQDAERLGREGFFGG